MEQTIRRRLCIVAVWLIAISAVLALIAGSAIRVRESVDLADGTIVRRASIAGFRVHQEVLFRLYDGRLLPTYVAERAKKVNLHIQSDSGVDLAMYRIWGRPRFTNPAKRFVAGAVLLRDVLELRNASDSDKISVWTIAIDRALNGDMMLNDLIDKWLDAGNSP